MGFKEVFTIVEMIPIILTVISSLAFVGVLIYAFVKGVLFLVKEKFPGKKKAIILSLGLMPIAALSCFFNIGWLRFFLILSLTPVTHAIFFLFTNVLAAKHFEACPKIKRWNKVFMITYVVFYVFLPDGGDYGSMHFLFGLIHNDLLSGIAMGIAGCAVCIHIALLFAQVVEILKIKKSLADINN